MLLVIADVFRHPSSLINFGQKSTCLKLCGLWKSLSNKWRKILDIDLVTCACFVLLLVVGFFYIDVTRNSRNAWIGLWNMKYELNYEYFKWIRIMNQLMALAFIELVLSEKVHVHADDVKFIAQSPTKTI